MTKASLYRVPILSSLLRQFDNDVCTLGIQKAFLKIANDTHARIIVDMDEASKRILESEQVLLISNHPGEADPLILFAALPSRRDTKLIVTDDLMGVSECLDRYFIPVHMRPHKNDETTPWRLQAYLMHEMQDKKEWTSESAHAYNVAQIQKASDALSEGELVVIYPFQHLVDDLWFPGVGFLLAGAHAKKPIYVINACVSGTSYWDWVRLLPLVGRFLPPFHVVISPPTKVNYLTGKPGKEVSEHLRVMYTAWAKEHNLPA